MAAESRAHLYIAELDKQKDAVISGYRGTSDDRTELVEPSASVPSLDKNNTPKYGNLYFDYVVCSLLLHELYPNDYEMSINLSEIVGRMAYDGLRYCDILTCDKSREDLCDDMMLNRVPPSGKVFDYMLWVMRYNKDHNALPVWFYHTLPLWILLDDKLNQQFAYRSKLLVNTIYAYGLVKITDLNAERTHDVLDIGKYLRHILTRCVTHEFNEDKDGSIFTLYILSTLREFSLVTLGTMIARKCAFDALQPLGAETRMTMMKRHQRIIEQEYKANKESTGTHE